MACITKPNAANRALNGREFWQSKPFTSRRVVLRLWSAMRLNGTLKNWNSERGFGVIAALQGGQQIFVHMSAFPRERRMPVEGDTLTFEIEMDGKGRRRACKVKLAEENWTLFADPRWPESKLDTLTGMSRPLGSRPRKVRRTKRSRSNLPWVLLGMLAILAAGWMALEKYSQVLIDLVAKPALGSSRGISGQPLPVKKDGLSVKSSSQSSPDRPR
jgi:cold shock CspA family protein